MPIIRSSRLCCRLPHWSFRSWFAVYWRLGAVRLEYYSSLTAPNLQPTANQERNDQCGNQHYSRELLMMGIIMLETCWAYSLQPGHYSSLTPPNLQPTANQERNDQCGNQHYSRELLMMGIVVPETCWAYKKYNKIISGIYLVFILQW